MPPGWAAFEGPDSALGELGGAAGGLQAVLFLCGSRYPLRRKALRVCHLSNSLG